MAEDGEAQRNVGEQQPSRRDILRRGWDLAKGPAGLTIARRLLPPGVITSLLGSVDSHDRSGEPVWELPPLPKFKSPDPDQRVLVVPIHAKGEKEPISLADIEHGLELVKYQLEWDSYKKMSNFSYKVLPWQEIYIPEERDAFRAVAAVGDVAVDRLKIDDLNQYNTRLYVIPPDTHASRGGVAFSSNMLGLGRYNKAIVHAFPGSTFNSLGAIAKHEIGHILGMPHANSVRLKGIEGYAGKTTFTEYAGSFDPMMGGGVGITGVELSAPQRVALGWIEREQVQSVTEDGIFTINNIKEGNGIMVLRLQKPDTDERYYISYKDNGTTARPTINIHTWKERKGRASAEVVTDLTWSDGATLRDNINGITIKQVSHKLNEANLHDPSSVTVEITFDRKR
jgi:hypothetical protein